MRKIAMITLLAVTMVMLMVGTAFAFATGRTYDSYNTGLTNDKTSPATSCASCHPTGETKHTTGPHGGYATGTNKCALCHTVHVAGNASLLPGATVTAACNFCHDLTGTNDAPYNMHDGLVVASAHRVVGVNFTNSWQFRDMGTKATSTHDDLGAGLDTTAATVPGSNGANGLTGTIVENAANTAGTPGQLSGTTFTCNSCHTPHALDGTMVNPYLGESEVKRGTKNDAGVSLIAGESHLYLTSRLLRKEVNNVAVTEYGSAWCATCHKGRDNMGGAFNHPVDESALAYNFIAQYTGTVKFAGGGLGADKNDAVHTDVYGNDFVLIDTDPTGGAETGMVALQADPRSNKQYALVPTNLLDSDNPGVDGFGDGNLNFADFDSDVGPSCQQCHASARNLENPWSNTNPGRMSFPHVSSNKALLVETGDDFCTNCHGTSNLP